MTGWTSGLAHGVAERLAAAGVGTYRPDGLYDPTETGIVIGTMPAVPPRVLALNPYPLSHSLDGDAVIGMQARARSSGPDPREALDLIDAAFDVLAGLSNVDLGGAWVHLIEHTGGGAMGRDDNDRYEHTATYQLTAHHPTTHRQ